MQVSAFISTTLDGFVARPNHQIDWLENADADASEDYGFPAFIKSISTVVMGRHTFERILKFAQWPYSHHRVIVLSSQLKTVPDELGEVTQLYNGSIPELAEILAAEGETHLFVDGAHTIQSFIAAGLLTNLTVITLPILIGEGIPLFGKIEQDAKLVHIDTRAYQTGYVQSHYVFT